ncbi:MAG TPA: RNA polymerase sigma factor RpoD/SigA [Fibrobacteria bacterium]|nr:RNA polymerase sigma factor RpoD/SigA [Fibrobacteria bacterium]
MTHSSMEAWEGATLYYQYIKDINKYPLLTRAEEVELLRRVKDGDPRAMNRLVCSNLKFVINVAFMYKNQGFSLPELINEGNLGLIEAAKRFDIGRNLKFISYAVWWIRQSITRAIAERARLVRISAEKELILRRFSKHNTSMRQTVGGGMVMDTEALGKKMGYTGRQVEKIIEMGLRHSSLDDPIGNEEGTSVLDLIEDAGAESPDAVVQEESRKRQVSELLLRLPDQEKTVLSMYFGIGQHDPLNLEEIGEVIGLSKERVRQIKEKGLAALRGMEEAHELAMLG